MPTAAFGFNAFNQISTSENVFSSSLNCDYDLQDILFITWSSVLYKKGLRIQYFAIHLVP